MNENSFLEVHWNISLVLVYSFFILEKLFQDNSTGLPRKEVQILNVYTTYYIQNLDLLVLY